MTYKAFHLITLVFLRLASVSIIALGLAAKNLGAGPGVWWLALGWGTAVLAVSLVFIGFTAAKTSEMTCSDCGKKVTARFKLGFSSRHPYLSKNKGD